MIALGELPEEFMVELKTILGRIGGLIFHAFNFFHCEKIFINPCYLSFPNFYF